MNVQVSQLAAFLGAIALIAKILDWYLTNNEKQRLRKHISVLLDQGAVSGSAVVKAPLSIVESLLDSALGGSVLSWKAIRRSASLSALLVFSCMALAGLLTDTIFAISDTPWAAYDSSVDELELIIESGQSKPTDTKSEEERRAAEEYYAEMQKLVSKARSVPWKFGYLTFMIAAATLVGIMASMLTLAFSRKVIKELQQTESLVLISGALLLGLVVSAVVVNLCLISLFTMISPLVAFSGAFGGLLFGHSALLGAGIASGYTLLTWLASPSWAKAISVASVVPSLLLVLVASISGVLYPVRNIFGAITKNLLIRAVQSEKGVLVFIATGATLLSAAVIMATNIVTNGKP